MKRIIILILVIICVFPFCFSGCNGANTNLQNAATSELTTQYECQVDFWIDNSFVDSDTVNNGEGVIPPAISTFPGKVFTGWDSPLNEITENKTVRPIFVDVSDENNCFAIDSVYGHQGEEVTFNLILRGVVNISSADFSISYDKESLKLKEITYTDPTIMTNAVEEDGIIYCSLLSDTVITADVDCIQLVFSVLPNATDSMLIVSVDDAATIIDDKIVDAEFYSVDGLFYVINKEA